MTGTRARRTGTLEVWGPGGLGLDSLIPELLDWGRSTRPLEPLVLEGVCPQEGRFHRNGLSHSGQAGMSLPHEGSAPREQAGQSEAVGAEAGKTGWWSLSS